MATYRKTVFKTSIVRLCVKYIIAEENEMGEYIGRINVSKDAMLFVVNNVFQKGIKESTTKENILKLMPEIYNKAKDNWSYKF